MTYIGSLSGDPGGDRTFAKGKSFMPFDPTLPAANSPISSEELRHQFTALQAEIDDRPDFGNLSQAIQEQTAGNISELDNLPLIVSDPPTRAQVQEIVYKLNDLIAALKRQ